MAYNDRYDESAKRRDAARRRRAIAMRKKRRRQVFIRKCMMAAAVVAVVGGLVGWCVRGKDKPDKESNIVEAQTVAVAADGDMEPKIQTPSIPYAQKAANYQEITDESIFSMNIAVLEVESGKVVAGRNYDTRIYPASMTKVMTLIVAAENIGDFSQTYTFRFEDLNELYIGEATVAGYEEDEVIGVDDLLYGLVLPSGADSAVALANMISGSEEAFAQLMNKKAQELGLKNTHFSNPTGLHAEDQYTTPAEMAMIMEAAMSNPVCAKYLSTYQHTTAATPQHPEGILLTSTMFSRMYGDEVEGVKITAGKTGYTDEARHCLVSYAEKNGKHYVAVISDAQDKWYSIFDTFALYKDYAG
ncbi:MAG: serine hydrolase [Lachnospira sp.]|nr:serine hydrolase [Lachnospira sp.]